MDVNCAQSCCLLIELIAFWTFSLPSSLAVGETLATTTATAMSTSKKAITSGFSVLYVYLLSRLRRENTLFHVLWRTLTSDDEYFSLFLNLSAVSKKSERNSPTFSAKCNKRDKVWKTRIHYKVTFSLPWPSSSLKLLSFVRFLNSRDPFMRSTPPFHRPGRVRLRWSVILTFPSVDEILWCCCGRRSVWFCWNVWSFLKFLPVQSNSNFLSLSVIRWTPLGGNIIYGWPQWYPC